MGSPSWNLIGFSARVLSPCDATLLLRYCIASFEVVPCYNMYTDSLNLAPGICPNSRNRTMYSSYPAFSTDFTHTSRHDAARQAQVQQMDISSTIWLPAPWKTPALTDRALFTDITRPKLKIDPVEVAFLEKKPHTTTKAPAEQNDPSADVPCSAEQPVRRACR